MATYNTLPTVSEDALINEPKAPQNRKAIAIVAAVCFAKEQNKNGLRLAECDEYSTNQMFDYYDGKLHQRARGDCLAPEYVDNFSPLHGVDCDDAWTRWVIN